MHNFILNETQHLSMFACLTTQLPTHWPLPHPQCEGMTSVLSGTKLGLCRSVPMNLQGQLLKPGFEVPLAAQGLCLKDTALSWAHLQKRVCSGNTYSLVGRLGLEKYAGRTEISTLARRTWLMIRKKSSGCCRTSLANKWCRTSENR